MAESSLRAREELHEVDARAPVDAPGKDSRSGETETQRLNRELDQLLQELRVAMPGVQVLFAFLLAVPFQQRFATVTAFEKDVYFATLLMSAIASALFIAPTAYHRITFRHHEKGRLIELSTRTMKRGA